MNHNYACNRIDIATSFALCLHTADVCQASSELFLTCQQLLSLFGAAVIVTCLIKEVSISDFFYFSLSLCGITIDLHT